MPTTSSPSRSTLRTACPHSNGGANPFARNARCGDLCNGKLAESRDPETGAHLERVRSYSRVLAQHLSGVDKFRAEINAEYVRLIYLTSPLHDIGKVGIPDCVLLKPGRLNDREFEIMKTHATLGAQTLDAALRQFPGVKFLQMGRDIAASHHERFDGTGYPQGLGGESIPLCAELSLLPMYTML